MQGYSSQRRVDASESVLQSTHHMCFLTPWRALCEHKPIDSPVAFMKAGRPVASGSWLPSRASASAEHSRARSQCSAPARYSSDPTARTCICSLRTVTKLGVHYRIVVQQRRSSTDTAAKTRRDEEGIRHARAPGLPGCGGSAAPRPQSLSAGGPRRASRRAGGRLTHPPRRAAGAPAPRRTPPPGRCSRAAPARRRCCRRRGLLQAQGRHLQGTPWWQTQNAAWRGRDRRPTRPRRCPRASDPHFAAAALSTQAPLASANMPSTCPGIT